MGGWVGGGEVGRELRHTSALCAGLHQLNQAHITLLVVRADPGALHLFPQCFSILLTKTDSSVFLRVLLEYGEHLKIHHFMSPLNFPTECKPIFHHSAPTSPTDAQPPTLYFCICEDLHMFTITTLTKF